VDSPNRNYAGLRHHVKVYSFRIITAILAWVFIGVAFYYRPDWIKWGCELTHDIAAVGDALPSPWGDRIEIVLRELGGFIWIQITVLIIFHSRGLFEHRDGLAVPKAQRCLERPSHGRPAR